MSSAKTIAPEWLDWPQTRLLIEAFAPRPGSLRFVGGAVRDVLLGRTVQDVDAATVHLPSDTLALLQQAGIKAIPTGMAHGTVTAVIEGKSFEITTLRKDTACDGRHAEVVYTDSWQEDAHRRDFTMNALYLSPLGELYDYVGGVDDARSGCVRFIGEASQRITEDYLRILRYFRFHAHYGKGVADKQALKACAAQAPHIAQLSGERIQSELLKLLSVKNAAPALELMQRGDVLRHVLGFGVHGLEAFARLHEIEMLTEMTLKPYVKMAFFLRAAEVDEQEASTWLAARLKLSNLIAQELAAIARRHGHITQALAEPEAKHWIRTLGQRLFIHILMLNWACEDGAISKDHPYFRLFQLAQHWQAPPFPLTGQDLLAAGFQPGKAMGELLQRLEALWEADDYRMDRQALLQKAKEL